MKRTMMKSLATREQEKEKKKKVMMKRSIVISERLRGQYMNVEVNILKTYNIEEPGLIY